MKESLEKPKLINMIRFEKNKTTFMLCDCGGEVLIVDYDPEYELADLCIYESIQSYNYKMSFWQKLRYIYRVLWCNRPYSDQIVLNREQLKDLNSFLNGCI